MSYRVQLATVAQETLAQANPAQKAAFDRLRRRLADDPRNAGTYNQKRDQYSADMGEHGVVLYTVHEQNVLVAVWRIQFIG